MNQINDYMVLIAGESAGGKSASLRTIPNPSGVLYLNCEAGKKLPFKSGFVEYTITDPLQVIECFDMVNSTGTIPHHITKQPVPIHTIVTDSITFMLDMYESVHILTSPNTQAAWGAFQQFFKTLMQDRVARAKVNVLFTAHTLATFNEGKGEYETKVPVKGALKNNGIEAYFSCVVIARKMSLKKLEAYKNDMLDITPMDEAVGYKHVFQTLPTKETVHERIRSPMGLFTQQQTFIDNDVGKLLNHLHQYYN